MPAMGPGDPSPATVDSAFKDVMQLLKEKHRVQFFDIEENSTWTKDREERNAKLREAIFGLLQLESWESF